MPLRLGNTWLLLLLLLAARSRAQAQVGLAGAVLNLPGVTGELDSSLGSSHAGQIQLQGFSWAVTRAPGADQSPRFQLSVLKAVDSASPALATQSTRPSPLAFLQLFPVNNVFDEQSGHFAPQDYEGLNFSNVYLTQIQQTCAADGSVLETVLFEGQASGDFNPVPAYANYRHPGFSSYLSWSADPWDVPFTGWTTQRLMHNGWVGLAGVTGLQFTNTAGGGRGAGGAPQFSDLVVQRYVDTNSAVLLAALQRPRTLDSVTIDSFFGNTSEGPVWSHLVLQGVTVTALSQTFVPSHDPITGVPDWELSETVQFHFTNSVTWSYSEPPNATNGPDTFFGGYDFDGSAAPAGSFATTTSVQAAPEGVNLSWPAVTGATYAILGSASLSGPYAQVQTVTATNTGPMSVWLPLDANRQFYRVQLPFEWWYAP